MGIWGDWETYKSWLVLDQGFSVAEGVPWLFYPTTQNNVLIINTELPEELYHERYIEIVRTRRKIPKGLYTIHDMTLKLDTQTGLAKMDAWVEASGAGLLIIDNLYRAMQNDINTNQGVNALLDNLSYLIQKYRVAITLVHHSRKVAYDLRRNMVVRQGAEDMGGNKYLANRMNTIIELRKVTVPNADKAILFIPEKATFERTPIVPLTLSITDTQFFPVLQGIEDNN